jgi:uncharacterized protein with von Willebrand factor type A (vWA) domain
VSATTVTADELLLGFARALRAAGVAVTGDRSRAYLDALDAVGLDDHRRIYWAGRATLCAGPEDFRAYDQVFDAWFGGEQRATVAGVPPPGTTSPVRLPEDDTESDRAVSAESAQRASASETEILRHRDIASLNAAERARLATMFARLQPVPPTRTSYRRIAARRGSVDTRATLRRTLTRMGEPVEIAWRHRSTRRRRTVLLVDVSGSMSSYADAVLRLAHRMSAFGPTEVFSVGTRVTRLTTAMRMRESERALVAAGETVPDWSGGTRLGEGLKAFLDRWGQRGLARGAVVVVFSDGWERGDATLLGEQMARLHRLTHRVVWVNPHKGSAGYQPVQQGMAAALPFVDDFVAGHSLSAFARVLEVVRDA